MWLRGDDLLVGLDEPDHAGREAAVGLSSSASPSAWWPKRKFSPTETCVAPRAPTRISSTKSSGDALGEGRVEAR